MTLAPISPPIVLSSSESSSRDRESEELLDNGESFIGVRTSGDEAEVDVAEEGEGVEWVCVEGEEAGGEKAETRSDKNVEARL